MTHFLDWMGQATSGPGSIRFFVQPAVALLLGVRDGLRDARTGDAPFVYRLLFVHTRKDLLASAWSTLALPLLVAFAFDSVLQVAITGNYKVHLSIVVGLMLVGVPYCLVRGIACRLSVSQRRRREA